MKSLNCLTKLCFFIILSLSSFISHSQEIIPDKNEIKNHKISGITISSSNQLGKKQFVDSMKFNKDGNLTEKRVAAYDTFYIRTLSGKWAYTYDSIGNRLLETRDSKDEKIMDYYNLVYYTADPHIKKRIWVYWVDMRHQFDRIYEYRYDTLGRVRLTLVEDGSEKIDTAYLYKYDNENHIVSHIAVDDKAFKDTLYAIKYTYDADGNLTSKITHSKGGIKTEDDFIYDKNKRLIKQKSATETITYDYDVKGMMIKTQRFHNKLLIPYNTCTYQYKFQ